MSQDRKANLQCTGCKQINYQTQKNKRLKDRLELKKFCNRCVDENTGKKGAHVLHKETK